LITNTMLQIKDIVQQFAEAASAALRVDVEVFDRTQRIAGTGKAKLLIGNSILPQGIINRFMFSDAFIKKIIINNPGEDKKCKLCPNYGNCFYKRAVYAAIEYEGNTIGVIGITAMDYEQVSLIEYNNYAMLDFVDKIAGLISSKFKEYEILKQVKAYAELMDTVIDSINKGIIVLNKEFKIVSVNDYILGKLMVEEKHVLDSHILDIFQNLVISFKEQPKSDFEYQEIVTNVKGKQVYLLCMMKSIYINNEIERTICLIEDYKDTTQLAYAIASKQNEILLRDIQGEDINFVRFKNKVKNVSVHDSTVLLTGETGTGKELFARAIHSESNRNIHPFISINCGALPETLIESELFGYEKGAFTGASTMGRHGKFYLANRGTIFLDEIQTMPLYLQPKLLRIIERREIERIGGNRSIPIDVRIIVASNVRLDQMVRIGEFREDLFHRLNVISLFIPPLRERDKDILVLSSYFIKKYTVKFKKNILGLAEEVKHIFLNYNWPGNVRELQNTIEYAINMEQGDYITVENLPFQFKELPRTQTIQSLESVERDYIIKALDHCGWSENGRIEAGKKLGVSRATIYRKIKKYNLL